MSAPKKIGFIGFIGLIAFYGGIVASLAGAFWLYLQPDFLIQLGTMVWMCG